MDKIFHDQINRSMKVYVDDLVVKSQSFERHVEDLIEILQKIWKYTCCWTQPHPPLPENSSDEDMFTVDIIT